MIIKILQKLRHKSIKDIMSRVVYYMYYWKLKLLTVLRVSTMSSRYGIRFKMVPNDATFKYYVCGSYGFEYSQHIRDIREAFLFLDVGANMGLYSILAARNKNCHGVFSFEPMPNTFRLLEENITLNKKLAFIKPFQLAITEISGIFTIHMDPTSSGSATILNTAEVKSVTLKEEVHGINHNGLSQIIEVSNTANIKVKIDVEGLEGTVIKQLLMADFSARISEILYEVDETKVDPKSISKFLQDNGFTAFKKLNREAHHYDILASRKV